MQSERLFLSNRADPSLLTEWMDEPCTYEDWLACIKDLAQVNRLTLAHRPTIQWLNRLVGPAPTQETLRILDVGSGGGDMLQTIAEWAKRRNLRVSLTGIDLNPFAARAANELIPKAYGIRWITGDAYSYAPTKDIDVVLSSLFAHHLPEPEIVRFLSWMESFAESGWFINDLHRSHITPTLFAALATAARWHRFVRHDGPVSIHRGFVKNDWLSMCSKARINLNNIRVEARFPGRLCVGRYK